MNITITATEHDERIENRVLWRVAKLVTTPSMPADYSAEFARIAAEFDPETLTRALMGLVGLSNFKWDGETLIVAELGGCSIDY